LLSFDETNQVATIEIYCSKGTYIRSIVNDLGMMLGCGATMIALQRIKSGMFLLSNSIKLNEDTSVDDIKKALLNPLEVLPFKTKEISDTEFARIKNGIALNSADYADGEYVCLKKDNILCAISQKDVMKNILITKKVFVQ